MKYTKLTKEQLADNFERVSKDFYNLIEDNGLGDTVVDMDTPLDNRVPELNLCNTPACHGGWASIMYGIEEYKRCGDFYELGAERLAKELGFRTGSDLEDWAEEYSPYWGSLYGKVMFEREVAFNKTEGALYLTDIAKWYSDVAKRLRA